MYPSNATKRFSRRVLARIKAQNAEALRSDRPKCPWVVSVGNTDLPAFVANGKLYLEAPLVDVFEAFGEDLSEFVRDLEVRVSRAGCTAFSLDSDGRPVYGSCLAESRLVSDSGWW